MVAARYAAVRPDADRWLRARYAAAACLSIDRKPRAVSLGRFTDDLLSSPLASRSPVAHYYSYTQGVRAAHIGGCFLPHACYSLGNISLVSMLGVLHGRKGSTYIALDPQLACRLS